MRLHRGAPFGRPVFVSLLALSVLFVLSLGEARGQPAPVSSKTPSAAELDQLSKALDVVASLKEETERVAARARLGAQLPLDTFLELLAQILPGYDVPEGANVAVAIVVDQGAVAVKPAVAKLRSRNKIGRPLYAALEGLWDAPGRIEGALIDRLWCNCPDAPETLRALEARGSRRALPAILPILFESKESEQLTWPARLAMIAIAGRDSDPDAALAEFRTRLEEWAPKGELARLRDVIGVAGSTKLALPFIVKTEGTLAANDLELRSECWSSYARIGDQQATDQLLAVFDEPKLDDKTLEKQRLPLAAKAIAHAKNALAIPKFVLRVATMARTVEPETRKVLLDSLGLITAQNFQGDPERAVKFGNDLEAARQSAEGEKDR